MTDDVFEHEHTWETVRIEYDIGETMKPSRTGGDYRTVHKSMQREILTCSVCGLRRTLPWTRKGGAP